MNEELTVHELILARDIMSRPVKRLTASAPVPDAAAFFLRHGISGAPVIGSKGRPIGVFSMSDIARAVQSRLISRASWDRTLEKREPVEGIGTALEGLEKATVGELMTPGLFTVFPEASLREVVRTMASQRIHRVFVISEKGELEGVITTMDVLRWMDDRYAVQPPEAVPWGAREGLKEEEQINHRA